MCILFSIMAISQNLFIIISCIKVSLTSITESPGKKYSLLSTHICLVHVSRGVTKWLSRIGQRSDDNAFKEHCTWETSCQKRQRCQDM